MILFYLVYIIKTMSGVSCGLIFMFLVISIVLLWIVYTNNAEVENWFKTKILKTNECTSTQKPSEE